MESTDIDLKAMLAILKRQRRLLGTTVAIVAGLALAYLLAATPIYTSTILIQVDGRSANLLDPTSAAQEQSAILNSRVDSEVEILRSEATALAVVREADLVTDPEFGPQLGWLERLGIATGTELDANGLRRIFGLAPAPATPRGELVNATLRKLQDAVSVRRRGLTYLIAISVSSASPDRAAEIANAYARVYIDRQVQTKTQATISARDVLRRQITTAQQDLAASETAINRFIEDNLTRLETETGDPAVAVLRSRLQEAKEAQTDTRTRIASAETAQAAGNWQAVATTLGDEALAELARQRSELEARLGTAEQGGQTAIDLQAELDAIDADLAAQSGATLRVLQEDLTTITSRETEARDQLRSLLLESDMSAEMLAELFNLQQGATAARNQYQTLLAREQDLGALANLQIADARVVSEALPPQRPASPNTRLILAMALIGGLGLGSLLAFVKEFYIGGIVSASQLANILQAPVPATFASLDQARSGEDPADVVIHTPMSLYAENFRKLRAAIDVGLTPAAGTRGDRTDHDAKADGAAPSQGKVILVSSALQAEGKSTTAIALARTYALAGAKTLLIDADMRKSTIGPRLGLDANPGLISFISPSDDPVPPTIQPAHDPYSPLVVIPAGPRSSAPTDQLLNSEAFRSLIRQAVRSFDIVLLDSPPLLPVVDTRYLAQHADAIIYVVRYATTTQGEVREALAQLRAHRDGDTHFVGVLNLEERGDSTYGYYARYSYYGDHD